ncbi:AMP-binding protein, partial [Streptomyces sp. 2MCAF27]
MNARANRVAHWLIGQGVGPEQLVGVAMPRSTEQVAVVLGILKAGAAYLPIDPEYPAERIAYIVTDANPALILTTRATVRDLPQELSAGIMSIDAGELPAVWERCPSSDLTDADRAASLAPAHPAYVIYTSGSTGRPKGVSVTHTGIAGLRTTHLARFGLTPDSRVLQFASPSFDAAVWELVMA